MTMISSVLNKLLIAGVLMSLVVVCSMGTANAKSSPDMVTVKAVTVMDQQVILKTDSADLSFAQFTLGAPTRLVVDVNSALPAFSERTFTLNNGMSAVRIGLYADKTRFVFDAEGKALPKVKVTQQGNDLIVQWGVIAPAAQSQQPVIQSVMQAGTPVSVESMDFDSQNGTSVFTVKLSAGAKLIAAKRDGDIVRFGVKNAVIPRSLRRVVDASVFPSSVLQITPYSTIVSGDRQVMFAAHMKGPVEFAVNLVDSTLTFRAQDGPFAEVAPAKLSSVTIPVMNNASIQQASSVAVTGSGDNQDQVAQVIESLSGVPCANTNQTDSMTTEGEICKVYTGVPVTLVFDDIDVRKVMQLIAEVSDQNLILSDDVKGPISLRLHDVPWDQALDLVLQIKELGTIQQGNVVRVLPLKKIDAMKTARLQAKKTIKTLEETQTQIFEVNYKDTKTIEDVIDDMISDQGEVSAIDGSKKIMVTDIPSKLVEIGELLKQLDEPVKQVMIEARIVEATIGSGLNLGVNWGGTYQNAADDTHGTGRVDNAQLSLGGGYVINPFVGTAGLANNVTFGLLGTDSLSLDLKLSALQSADKLKIVSSPKVLTLDGEESEISDGVQIPYKTTSDSGTTTEFQDATLSLKVTPEVNPNGTVILEIDVSNSRPGATYSDGTGIDKKNAKTKLMLKDGATTVIGGVYVDSITDSSDGVPWLKDIPVIGNIFKSTISNKSRRELLIFITPHIIIE